MIPSLKSLDRGNLELLLHLVSQCANARSVSSLADLLSELRSFIPYNAAAIVGCVAEDAQLKMGPRFVYSDYVSDAGKIGNPDISAPGALAGQGADAAMEEHVRSQLCRPSCSLDRKTEETPSIQQTGEFVSICMHSVRQSNATCMSLLGDISDISNRGAVILHYLMPYLHDARERIYPLHNRRAKDSVDLAIQMHTGGASGLKKMTGRESEILEWVAKGKSNWEISMILSISERTVKYHVGNIYRKLDATNRAQAIAKAAQWGLLSESV